MEFYKDKRWGEALPFFCLYLFVFVGGWVPKISIEMQSKS